MDFSEGEFYTDGDKEETYHKMCEATEESLKEQYKSFNCSLHDEPIKMMIRSQLYVRQLESLVMNDAEPNEDTAKVLETERKHLHRLWQDLSVSLGSKNLKDETPPRLNIFNFGKNATLSLPEIDDHEEIITVDAEEISDE